MSQWEIHRFDGVYQRHGPNSLKVRVCMQMLVPGRLFVSVQGGLLEVRLRIPTPKRMGGRHQGSGRHHRLSQGRDLRGDEERDGACQTSWPPRSEGPGTIQECKNTIF